MTERGLPSVDTATACPFVAFDDDREARSTSPDHRHRCYAELVPSPRAAAHQEAYCLSSAFPVCPTFQDWARREAAHARGEGERPRQALVVHAESDDEGMDDPGREPTALPIDDRHDDRDRDRDPRHILPPDDPPIRRNPPRDWAAPPPWAPGGTGQGTTGSRRPPAGDPEAAPGFLAGRDDGSRGLAGSAADRLAAGPRTGSADDRPRSPYEPEVAPPDDELAGLVGGRRSGERPGHDYLPPRSARRPTVSSTRSRDREREREHNAVVGPSWEHSRRYEAYPTIRSRAGLPSPPRLAVLAGALVIAAVILFFAPALLGIGGGGGAGDGVTARPSANSSLGAESSSVAPSASAPPTSEVYLVEAGDTMSKIATRFGLTLEELCNANKETIPDCDKIAIGVEVTIPERAPAEFTEPSASPS
jgi:LysM domain